MATFLTTPKMNPALRARVERSVSREARARRDAAGAGLERAFAGRERIGAGRVIAFASLVVVSLLFGAVQLRKRSKVAAQRDEILADLSQRRAGSSLDAQGFLATSARWVGAVASKDYEGDLALPELHAPGALDEWLMRPAVYIRGAAPELADPKRLDHAAGMSIKDAFLLCLVDPPRSPEVGDVLSRIQGVHFGGARVERDTANVARLLDARTGLAVLTPAFEEEARAAGDLGSLARLRKRLDALPTGDAAKPPPAELLIVVVDEVDGVADPDRTGPAIEPLYYRAQDAPHHARVALVDLASERVLLRTRQLVDGSKLSSRAIMHRVAVQACELAMVTRDVAVD